MRGLGVVLVATMLGGGCTAAETGGRAATTAPIEAAGDTTAVDEGGRGGGAASAAEDGDPLPSPTTAATETTVTVDVDSIRAAVDVWSSDHFEEMAEVLPMLMASVQAIATEDEAGLADACTSMGDWAARMAEVEPIPAPAVDAEWQDHHRLIGEASATCITAITEEDGDQMEQAGREMQAAADARARLNEELAAIYE
ncbi:MAG: hypothetical protein JWM05_1729 [Acidimicrobiales bacterium]|nr:hypothetical protein [Acidimicrobiales bacterium]